MAPAPAFKRAPPASLPPAAPAVPALTSALGSARHRIMNPSLSPLPASSSSPAPPAPTFLHHGAGRLEKASAGWKAGGSRWGGRHGEQQTLLLRPCLHRLPLPRVLISALHCPGCCRQESACLARATAASSWPRHGRGTRQSAAAAPAPARLLCLASLCNSLRTCAHRPIMNHSDERREG